MARADRRQSNQFEERVNSRPPNVYEERAGMRRGTIPPSWRRNFYDRQGHARPNGGRDNDGNPWQGMSRIQNPAQRRRKNRRTWAKVKALARAAAVAAKAES